MRLFSFLLLLLCSTVVLGQGKISDMPTASDLTGSYIPIIQGGLNKKAPATLFGSNFTTLPPLDFSANILSFPSWPTNASGVLQNDGSGNLSWATLTSSLSSLSDVNISSPSNNQFLRYKTSDNKWHNDSFTAGTDYEVPLTFSTGLTRTVNTITVNTSQNISTLSNLTSNGLIKTSGGTGALSIATSGTDYAPATSGTSVLKGDGSGGFSNATGSDLNTTFGSQTANYVYAAPNGSAGTPSFRALVANDIPSLSSIYVPYTGATSNVLLGSFYINPKNVLLSDQSAPSAPSSGNLILQSFNQQGFSVAHVYDPQGNATEITRDNIFVARNNTGSSIAKGKVVYCNGSTGVVPTIALAKADALSTLTLIGVMYETTANNSFGRVMMLGNLENFDLSAFTTGDVLYVSATTAGNLTNVAPTYPNIAEVVGVVLNNGVGNGVLEVYTRGTKGVASITDGQALTKTDDTNVTLTLGGTPATSLLKPVSLTLGWTGTLSIARGGTNNSSFTSGSVIYFDGTKLAEDNSNFYWDATNHRLGIGNTVPATKLHISTVSTSATRGVLMDQYSNDTNGSQFSVRKSRSGTFGSFVAVANGDNIGNYFGWGDDGTSFQKAAAINISVSNTVSTGVVPGQINLQTANNSGNLVSGLTIDHLQRVYGTTNAGLSWDFGLSGGGLTLTSSSAFINPNATSDGNTQLLLSNATQGNISRFIYQSSTGMILESLISSKPIQISGVGISATSGNYYLLKIGNANTQTFSPSSGTATYTTLLLNPEYNTSGGTPTAIGWYYKPTRTATTGLTEIAGRSDAGQLIFTGSSSDSPNSATRLDVRATGTGSPTIALSLTAAGTTTNKVFKILQSDNTTEAAYFQDKGALWLLNNLTAASYTPIAGTTSVAPIVFTSSGASVLTTPTSNSIEVDANSILYYTHASSERGVVDAEQFIAQSGTYTLTNNNNAQPLFNATTNGAITLSSTKTYQFEGQYSVTGLNNGTGTISIGFGGTVTISSIAFQVLTTKVTGLTAATGPALSFWTSAAGGIVTSSNTNTSSTGFFKGIVRVTTTGTFIPQITMNASSAAAATVGANTWFRIWPIGTSSVTNIGNWN